jgi:hypothetical protein
VQYVHSYILRFCHELISEYAGSQLALLFTGKTMPCSHMDR